MNDDESKKTRGFAFTSFKEDIPVFNERRHRYMCFQREICPKSGRHHWQGYIHYKSPVTLQLVRREFDKDHVETAQKGISANRNYCRKSKTAIEGTFEEHGAIPAQGQRTDWEAFKQDVKDGKSELELADNHTDLLGRYPGGYSRILAMFRPRPSFGGILREWQETLCDELMKKPDDRKVLWYVDECGGTGKSWMARWCLCNMQADLYTGGKVADVAYACTEKSIQLFDLSREKSEFFSYDAIEQLKNGCIFSPKYESGLKVFAVPHVVVFANWWPDMKKLSADRWEIRNLMAE